MPSNQVIDATLESYRFADPGAASPFDPALAFPFFGDGFETDRGIVSGESGRISNDGTLIVTSSKADGRTSEIYPTRDLTENTAHLRLWTAEGDLLWDRARSRGPDLNGDGRPDDQPFDGEDEIEAATFSAHSSNADRYVVAGGEDDVIEVWEVRDAAGNTLAEPVLARTLFLPSGRVGGIDGLEFSTNGEFLVAGTEAAGKIEVWRATGDASTWERIGGADHGGTGDQAVNAIDFSADDRFLASAGTNSNGVLWRVDVMRNADGEAIDLDLVRLATMDEPTGSTKGIEFDPIFDRYIAITGVDDRTLIYDGDALKGGDAGPVQALSNAVARDGDIIGSNSESLAFSDTGRFLVVGSGPNRDFPDNSAGYEASFLRIYESAEVLGGEPEPDPVFVQATFGPEDFNWAANDERLVTVHEDGTLRAWDLTIGGAETIEAEAFNERGATHDRWTLEGSLSLEAGDNEWGVTTQARQSEINARSPSLDAVGMEVLQNEEWAGHRGSRYLAADNLQGETHALTLNDAFDVSGFTDLQVSFAAAGSVGTYEAGDFLRLLADTNGDGAFETTVAQFLPDVAGNLALEGTGETLDFVFQDFHVDLETVGASDAITFRIEANTDGSNEELALDSLRVTGFAGAANDAPATPADDPTEAPDDIPPGGGTDGPIRGTAGDDVFGSTASDETFVSASGDQDTFAFGAAFGDDTVHNFDVDGGDESSFDTIVLTTGPFAGAYATTDDLLGLVLAVEKDKDGATDAMLDRDDLVFDLGGGSIRLAGVVDGDDLTVAALEAQGIDLFTF